jgi:hypothetical protein
MRRMQGVELLDRGGEADDAVAMRIAGMLPQA